MGTLFTALTHAVEGAPGLALAAAFLWGVLSIVLSPCHLSSIPLIVGFIGGQSRMTTGRAFVTSLLFAAGILVTIALIGVITAIAGRMLGDLGRWGNYGVAALFLLVGLVLLDVLRVPWTAPGGIGPTTRGLLAALVLGLVFGVALGPCTFAYMAPMLAVTFRLATTKLWYGVLLLAAYGLGHCSVIVLAGTSTEMVQKFMNWQAGSRGTVILKRVCGALVFLAGAYMIYTA